MSELIRIPFHGTEVLTVEVDGRPHVVLRPAIEALGLAYQPQHRKLAGKSWARVTTRVMQIPGDDQRREHVVVDVRTFLMLLATIDEHRVKPEVRPLLVAFQAEVADAIEAYWTRGGAINPRATDDQLAAIIGRARAQMEVLRLADGLVSRDWLEAKARHVAARALGEEPEIDLARRPLTVGEYLEERGITGPALRSLSPAFGKTVKRLYRDRYDREPPQVDRFVDGALRKVAAYTEADRELFDAAFVLIGATR